MSLSKRRKGLIMEMQQQGMVVETIEEEEEKEGMGE
jgi:hypothetical protein